MLLKTSEITSLHMACICKSSCSDQAYYCLPGKFSFAM